MSRFLELIYEGRVFTIWAYKKETGEVPVIERLDKMAMNYQVKFGSLFSQLGNEGKIYNETKFKHLTGTDLEMKSSWPKKLKKNLSRGVFYE